MNPWFVFYMQVAGMLLHPGHHLSDQEVVKRAAELADLMMAEIERRALREVN